MLSSLALRSFIFHPNQWLVLKATRQAAKGFPDEDAAWIDGLAQRLDVANQLARRVAATTDPELRWRRSTTSTGFSWIPAYGQKIDPRSNSLFGRENSLFGKNNSLFRQKKSLFHLLGNIAASI